MLDSVDGGGFLRRVRGGREWRCGPEGRYSCWEWDEFEDVEETESHDGTGTVLSWDRTSRVEY